jgi:F-type H+-transporting ATPase subunit delta
MTASLQGRYAAALFELASDKGEAATVESDLESLAVALTASADFAALIRDPRLTRASVAGTVEAISGLLNLSGLTRNFLGVLADNGRLAVLPDAIAAFRAIAAAARGEVAANVTSAHPLTAAQLKALAAKLKAREGKDVKINASVDPELLGGLVVRIGSIEIDNSIRTRLNSLAHAMKG